MNEQELALLLNYAKGFLGYGDLAVPYWFVGREEAGVQEPCQALVRAKVWNSWKSPRAPVVDIQEYVTQLRVPKPLTCYQATWRPLIRLLLEYAPELRVNVGHGPVGNKEICTFQANRWGRTGSRRLTCLLELFGLPTASSRTWAYDRCDNEAIRTRENGTNTTFHERKRILADALEQRLVSGGLKLVVFYARDDYRTTLWSEVCGINNWRVQSILSSGFLWQRRGESLFLCIRHPGRGRIGKDQEAAFMRELAKQARRL
jgi:hypothetical protein